MVIPHLLGLCTLWLSITCSINKLSSIIHSGIGMSVADSTDIITAQSTVYVTAYPMNEVCSAFTSYKTPCAILSAHTSANVSHAHENFTKQYSFTASQQLLRPHSKVLTNSSSGSLIRPPLIYYPLFLFFLLPISLSYSSLTSLLPPSPSLSLPFSLPSLLLILFYLFPPSLLLSLSLSLTSSSFLPPSIPSPICPFLLLVLILQPM